MNYIKKLQAEVSDAREVLTLIANEVQHLYVYLQSPKFHDDTTVQVQDVLNRTQQIRTLASTNLGFAGQEYTPREDSGYALIQLTDFGFSWQTDKHQGSGGSLSKRDTTLEEVILLLQKEGIHQFQFLDRRNS